jgi:hypothetical protein
MTSRIYITIVITALILLAVAMSIVRKDGRRNRLTPLGGIAFALVAAGILFGERRLIGYSFLGLGVLIAVVDMIRRLKNAPPERPGQTGGEPRE